MFQRALVFGAMFTLLLAFGAMGSAAAGGGCIPAAGAPTEGTGLTVSIKSCLFGPAILHAPVGGTITWTNDDHVPHAVAGAGWSANTEPYGTFNAGTSVTHTFNAAGIYTYMCHLHPGMAGVVIVGDVVFPPAPPAPLAPTTVTTPASGDARPALPPVEAPVAGGLVAIAAVSGYAFARWPRRWRPSAAAIRAALVDRRDPCRGHDQLVELSPVDDRDARPDRPGEHEHAVARSGADL